MIENNTIRLNKYISESGICSRREADKFIASKVVFINGKCAKMGDQVNPTDVVRVNGIIIEPKAKEDAIYIAFNKPVGITCTTDPGTKDNIINYISYGERIFPVGRLDKDSQGLILLTSNGDIVNKILRAGNQHEKEYLVTVDKPITEQFIKAMSAGVPILGINTKKCKIVAESKYVFRIILIQGLNRQIRRMCEHFNYEVLKLERIRIMNLTLKGIPIGEYRELKKHELEGLHEMLAKSEPFNEPKKDSSPKTETKKNTKKTAFKTGDRKKNTAVNTAGKKPFSRAGTKSKSSHSKSSKTNSGRSGRSRK
jgi:23S rRNA pseudouridine2604 synthase